MYNSINWQDEASAFGIDWEEPLLHASELAVDDILETTCPLCFEDFEELKFTVPPLRKSDDYGIDVYCQGLEFVSLKISV